MPEPATAEALHELPEEAEVTSGELDFVLTPAAATEGELDSEAAAASTSASEGAGAPLLTPQAYEAGSLILEENRVAVSMLQRRFSLDFDQACDILDVLQEVGLIGPYVGGRTRDILMSAEDWEALAPETATS